jgi:RHS repeat-associated protein
MNSRSRERTPSFRMAVLTLSVFTLFVLPVFSDVQAPAALTLLPGQTATLLPDARSLLVGGQDANGPSGHAAIWDPRTKTTTSLVNMLQTARAWHTATILPNGTVLIVGGMDKNGNFISAAELYDPSTQRFALLPATALTPRASHTATLLTEGRVLITGGLSDQSEVLDRVELWNPVTQKSDILSTTLRTARQRHMANLMWDGTILLWGGEDAQGRVLATGELYDPDRRTFISIAARPFSPQFSTLLEASLPEDGATAVPINSVIALRFSQALRVETLNAATVTVNGPQGPQVTSITPAENGMLAFVTPKAPLLSGTTYQVSFNGPTDANGVTIAARGFSFTTQGTSAQQSLGGVAAPGFSSAAGVTAKAIEPPKPQQVAVPPTGAVLPTALSLDDPCGQINSGPPPPPKGPILAGLRAGDPVDLGTGLFIMDKTDLVVDDVLPLVLTRTYNPTDPIARPFQNMSHSYAIFLWDEVFASGGQGYQQVDLILPNGSRVRYVRTSPGESYAGAVFEHRYDPNLPGSAGAPSRFYASTIKWNGDGWSLTLRDGTVYLFGDRAPLQAIRDRYGNMITLTWSGYTLGSAFSGTGAIVRITSSNGRWIDFKYDDSSHPSLITRAQDNTGRTVKYEYDNKLRLWKVTDPENGVTEYTYYDAGNCLHCMKSIKDARGMVFLTNEYDDKGRVIKQTQADLTTFKFDYKETNGKITQTDVTDPRGTVRRVTFNAAGYPLTDTRALNKPEQQAVTYDWESGTNLLVSVTDSLGRKTAYTYDPEGNLESVTRPAGTAAAVTTKYTYEPLFNQLASVEDPLHRKTIFTYDVHGKLTSVTNPMNQTWSIKLTNAGRTDSITGPPPINAKITFGYEGSSLATITDPLIRITTRYTDSAGRLISLTNPLGQTTRYDYDGLNLLTKVTDPRGGQTIFTYDPNGNLKTVKDANNHATSYDYDNMDRLKQRIDPLMKAETYDVYDENGNLMAYTDRNKQITTIAYDPLNRRQLETYADGSTRKYIWDNGNRLRKVEDSRSGIITLDYDDLDRLTRETTPQGLVSYTYYASGLRKTMQAPGQQQVFYTYDDADQLKTITQADATVTLDYDEVGRRKSLSLPSGITVFYDFDAASQLRSLTYKQGAKVLGDLVYDYDQAGNRIKVGGSWARTSLPQAVGSITYDEANRQRTFDTAVLTYDNNGNLTSTSEAGRTAIYTWNARNQLTGMSAGADLAANFMYDGVGRRISKTINGMTTSFAYDGLNPVQEKTAAGVSNILTGLGIDEFFTRTDSVGARTFLADTVGSTIALTDNRGSVETSYTYEPFGNTPAGGTNSFQYTGRENDGTGLYYYRARYYSSRLQRFVSEDPFCSAAGDRNYYAYVGNSPLNATDPLGLWQRDVHYDLTKWLARQAGFSPDAADAVASANQGMDDSWETCPTTCGFQARKDHFPTKERLAELWNTALRGGLIDLGRFLHSRQDSFSHAGYGPALGHSGAGSAPDITCNRPELAMRMAQDTYNHLRAYREAQNGMEEPDNWDYLKNMVGRKIRRWCSPS